MGPLSSDLHYSLRTLVKDRGFTLIAVLSLALGIGVNSTVFSVAEAALLRSWPAQAPERLAKIVARSPQGVDAYFSYPDYQDLNQQSRAFDGVLAWSRHSKNLRVGTASREILDDLVSPNYFATLGLSAELGRTFSPAEQPSSALMVVVSDDLWRRSFGADPALVGKQIVLTNRNYTVIGIAPPKFRGLERGVPTDLWLTATTEISDETGDRSVRDFELLGRLRTGATASQAQAELDTISHRLADAYPAFDKARSVTLISEQERLRQVAFPTFLLMAAVALVLLISSANVAGLVLARSESRRPEMAVRLALGAGRVRLIRQLLTESAVLAGAGAALGLVLTRWLFKLQPAFFPPMNIDVGLDLRLDAPVMAFTLGVSALSVLIFGLAPALQASKTSLTPALKSGSAGGASGAARRLIFRNGLVLAEVALSVVLLTASGLLLRSLLYSRGIRLGFDAGKNLVFFPVEPGTAKYSLERSLAYLNRVRDDVAGLPGVRHVTYARRMLLTDSGGGAEQRVSIPGVVLPQGQPNIPIKFNAVGPGYFQTVGTRILQGRDFTAADNAQSAKVVLISQTMARRFWPAQDAVGRHIVAEGKDCRIAGVVEDAKINDVHEGPEPYLYFPFAQSATDWGTLIIETAGDPRALTATIRNAIRREDQNVPVGVFTLHFLMQEAYWSDQMAAGFVGGLSALGIFLASVGLYGVIAYVVNRRRREIGIRMALGAERRDVLRLVLAQGLRLAAIGTATGLAAAWAVTRLMSNLLYGVKPTDPLSFAASALIAIMVAVTASSIPALRASRVEPNVALRYE